MWSVYKGHTEIVEILLQWGANIHLTVSVSIDNIAKYSRYTCLYVCVSYSILIRLMQFVTGIATLGNCMHMIKILTAGSRSSEFQLFNDRSREKARDKKFCFSSGRWGWPEITHCFVLLWIGVAY